MEGDFDNASPLLYGGEVYLKCAHAGGVLAGQWTSPIIDLGASAEYLLYALNDINVTGQGLLWRDKLPSPVKWSEVDVANKRWREIFELSAAPSVEMECDYGLYAVSESTLFKLEILAGIVTGRYYQLKVNLTDPQSEVYALVEGPNLKFAQ